MMDVRKKSDFWPPHYGTEDVNLPWGCVDGTGTGLSVKVYPAVSGNWRTTAHSDWMEVNNRIGDDAMWFPKIYLWYNEFWGEGTHPSYSAIPIGKEF